MSRVLMTTDTSGGVWTYSLTLARELARHGVSVHLATLGPLPSAEQRRQASTVAGLTLYSGAWRVEWMSDPWDDVQASGRWLLDLARAIQPDLVHLNGYAHARLDFGVPRLVVGHTCMCTWWRAVHGEEAPPRYARYRDEVAAGLAAADRVLTPTESFGRDLEAVHGALPHRYTVYHGVVDRRQRRNGDAPVVLAAGRVWDVAKGFSVLDDIADRLPWQVQLAGPAVCPDGVSRDANRVEMLGDLTSDELAARMASATILCHPARYEPFGLVPLEAAMSGCALVLSDLPSLREIWGDGAVYATPGDPSALLEQIGTLIGSPYRLAALQFRGRERARRYTAAAMARATLDHYRALTLSAPQVELREVS